MKLATNLISEEDYISILPALQPPTFECPSYDSIRLGIQAIRDIFLRLSPAIVS